MKSLSYLYAFALILSPICQLQAQDLSGFKPVAWYSLIDSASDKLGTKPPIKLTNTPFDGAEGVYSNGKYLFAGPIGGCLIESPEIKELYSPTFAVGLEFKIDSLDGKSHPVIMLGLAWRYLGLTLLYDNRWAIEFNGYTYAVPDSIANVNQWYNFTLVYSSLDSVAYYYLDGQLMHKEKGPLIRDDSDGFISNTHFGDGITYRGNWRNLRIFQSENLFSSIQVVDISNSLQLYPNLVLDQIQIVQNAFTFDKWEILDISGRITGKSGRLMSSSTTLQLSDLMPGIYIFIATDRRSGQRISHRFIKL